MKNRNPARLHYYKDDFGDVQLRMASWASRGIWGTMVNLMSMAPEYGRLTGTLEQFCNAIGATKRQMKAFLADLRNCGFGDLDEDGEILTISCRRMVREAENDEMQREQARERKRRERERSRLARDSEACHAPVTPMSQLVTVCHAHVTKPSEQESMPVSGDGHAHVTQCHAPIAFASPDKRRLPDVQPESAKQVVVSCVDVETPGKEVQRHQARQRKRRQREREKSQRAQDSTGRHAPVTPMSQLVTVCHAHVTKPSEQESMPVSGDGHAHVTQCHAPIAFASPDKRRLPEAQPESTKQVVVSYVDVGTSGKTAAAALQESRLKGAGKVSLAHPNEANATVSESPESMPVPNPGDGNAAAKSYSPDSPTVMHVPPPGAEPPPSAQPYNGCPEEPFKHSPAPGSRDRDAQIGTLLDMTPEKERMRNDVRRNIAQAFDLHGAEYVTRNVQYVNRRAKSGYAGYLAKALAGDFAKDDAEVSSMAIEQRTMAAAIAEQRLKEEKETWSRVEQDFDSLPEAEQECLKRKAMTFNSALKWVGADFLKIAAVELYNRGLAASTGSA